MPKGRKRGSDRRAAWSLSPWTQRTATRAAHGQCVASLPVQEDTTAGTAAQDDVAATERELGAAAAAPGLRTPVVTHWTDGMHAQTALAALVVNLGADNRRICGHAVVGRGVTMAIEGEELLAAFDCQQEDGWALMTLRIRMHRSHTTTITVLAERTGGDAIELNVPRDSGALSQVGVSSIADMPQVTFKCNTLKSGTDAKQHLARFHPEMVAGEGGRSVDDNGDAAVVNFGLLKIEPPDGLG